MIGETYLERGEPVVVLARWLCRSDVPQPVSLLTHLAWTRTGPRNVLIRRANGELVVRSFRGLRRSRSSAVGEEIA
jgi:acetyl esterase